MNWEKKRFPRIRLIKNEMFICYFDEFRGFDGFRHGNEMIINQIFEKFDVAALFLFLVGRKTKLSHRDAETTEAGIISTFVDSTCKFNDVFSFILQIRAVLV